MNNFAKDGKTVVKKENPYLNIGGTSILPKDEILGIFDLDTASTKTDTKRYLSAAEKKGRMISVGLDLPKAFVVVAKRRKELVYITTLSVSTLEGRWKRKSAHL